MRYNKYATSLMSNNRNLSSICTGENMKDRPAIISIFFVSVFVLNACTPQAAAASNPTSTISPTLIVPASATSIPSVAPTTTTPASPSALSATMSEMEGIVEVKPAGQDTFTPAQPNSLLVENSQVQTGANGRVRLDISTGTIVRVAPSSIFTLISNTPSADGLVTRLQLVLGEMYVVLSGGSLDVETPTGTASVRGSYMSVSYLSTGSVRITCLEGHCSLSTPAGRVDITAGQSAEVVGAG